MESTEGIGTGWTMEKVRASMMERPQFEAEGLFFVPLMRRVGGRWRVRRRGATQPRESGRGTCTWCAPCRSIAGAGWGDW